MSTTFQRLHSSQLSEPSSAIGNSQVSAVSNPARQSTSLFLETMLELAARPIVLTSSVIRQSEAAHGRYGLTLPPLPSPPSDSSAMLAGTLSAVPVSTTPMLPCSGIFQVS